MPLPETTGCSEQLHRLAMRRCMRRAAICVGALIAGSIGIVWHETHADTLMARIHHGQIICTEQTVEYPLAKAASGLNEAMVLLDLEQSQDGRIMVVQNGTNQFKTPQPLSDVLNWAHRRSHMLFLINMHDIEPQSVTALLKKTRMIERVILNAPDRLSAQAAFAADPNLMVAVSVRSVLEEQGIRRIAHSHPYALYLRPDASAHLFAVAHHDADVVITNSSGVDPETRDVLTKRPIDVFVTDSPSELSSFRRDG